MTLEDLLQRHVAVVGITGSGKSYAANHLHARTVRTSIFCDPKDTPETPIAGVRAERWSKSLLQYSKVHLVIDEDEYPKVFDRVRQDVRDVGRQIQTGRGRLNRWCVLWADEADELAPEGSRSGPLHSAVKRLRSSGVSVGVVTQAPADVAKGVLKQCNTHFLFRLGLYEGEYAKTYNLPVVPGQLNDRQFLIATERDCHGPFEI